MSVLPDDARARYFEHLPLPLWAVDADERTVDVNPAVVAALGYPVEELLGRSPTDFLTEDSRATYHAQAILRRSGLADSFYCTFHTKSGGTRVFRVSGSPVYDGDTYAGKIAVLRDVADWNAIEQEVRDANPKWFGPDPGGLVDDLSHSLQAIAVLAARLLQGTPGPLHPEQSARVLQIADAARAALDRLRQFDAPPRAEPGQVD